ncbi:MAG: kinase [Candidatus Omnitrophica bacterium]|nr:kinase [Candidatus Omnitrophota bacterium]MCM8803474.1 kinase [Candidatus Omnitrophota bacterium]
MVITRTPFRISFFGGGTDYPSWYRHNKGAVLTATIDKYCYISCRYLPPFFEHKHRIVYSIIENVKEIEEIKHPAVRGILKYLNIDFGVEIHHDGDLPARTGLGSSSSFTVGLLNALYALLGKMKSKEQLAKEAIYVEQEILKENVGCQDQIEVAYGGLNKITFLPDDSFVVESVILPPGKKDEFEKHLLLYFTGISRYASEIAKEQIKNIENKKYELKILHEMVDEGIKILIGNSELKDFGKLLDEAWRLKRTLSDKVSNPVIDEIYERAKKAGALGGKLLGAGGGGFMLFFAPPELHQKIKEEIKGLFVPFKFENQGSQIIFYQM